MTRRREPGGPPAGARRAGRWAQALPGRAAIVAGHGRVEQEVQAQVLVELLSRAGVQRLGQAFDLRHEAVHVALHGREVQREALHRLPGRGGGLSTRRGRRQGRLLAAAPPGLPALAAPGPVQQAQQQQHAHPSAHGRAARARGHLRRAGGLEAAAAAAAAALGAPGRRAPVAPARSPRSPRWARQRKRGRLGVEAPGTGRRRPGQLGLRARPARAAQGLGALAPARANKAAGAEPGRSLRGPRRPGCPRVRCAAAARLGGGGGGRARSFLGGGIAFSSQTASLTEGPGLPRRGRRRRSRPGSVGGSAAPRSRQLHSPRPARRRRPRPREAGRGGGAGAGGGGAGQERGFSAPGLRLPRRGRARRGWGAQGGCAHLSRPGAPRHPPPPRPGAARGPPEPRPAPPAPNGPEPRAHRGRPRGPGSSASLALRQPAGTPARLRSPLALARSRPGLLSSGAPGIKATADTGPRAEGPAAAAPGPPGGADRCGAGPGALGDLREAAGAPARRHGGVARSRRLDGQILSGAGKPWGAATYRGRWASGWGPGSSLPEPWLSAPPQGPPRISPCPSHHWEVRGQDL